MLNAIKKPEVAAVEQIPEFNIEVIVRRICN